jgi:stage II sporulation protein GA (sporulation sigma-E factor processing peptidase)
MLIFLLKKVSRKKSGKLRMMTAAAIGALTALIISMIPWMNSILKVLLLYGAGAVLMILTAFGRMKGSDLLKQFIVLNLITYFVGGLMNSIYYQTNLRMYLLSLGKSLLLSNVSWLYVVGSVIGIVILVLLLLRLFSWYHRSSPETYEVELHFEGRSVSTRGLMDSGNCLYDPIYKRPVMVIENSLINDLLTPDFAKDIETAKTYLEGNELDTGSWDMGADSLLRLRFIPYRSVGKSGMLLGVQLDKVLIRTGKETICNEKVTAAFCDNPLSSKEEYHVILHKELL